MAKIEIIQGDCLEIMKTFSDNQFDLVLTDPPYPDYHEELYEYPHAISGIKYLHQFRCKQVVFWSAKAPPVVDEDLTAIHIWDKKTGCGSMYERIFEYYGQSAYKVYRHYLINSTMAASFTRDVWTKHPSQKPIKLICELVEEHTHPNDTVLDPFLGSGTTAVACERMGRNCVGIEISPEYCEIARKRVQEEKDKMGLFPE